MTAADRPWPYWVLAGMCLLAVLSGGGVWTVVWFALVAVAVHYVRRWFTYLDTRRRPPPPAVPPRYTPTEADRIVEGWVPPTGWEKQP